MRTEPRRWLGVAVAATLLLLSPGRGAVAAEPALEEMHGVPDLAERFEAEHGKPRLLLLLSPT